MLFQTDPLIITLYVITATFIVAIIIALAVILIESKIKAKNKIILIVVLALIVVLILPFIRSVVILMLTAIGDLLAGLRNLIDGGGQNYLLSLVPIIGFISLLVLTKYLLDVQWDKAAGISLVTLITLYIIYSFLPELYLFLQIG